MEQFTTQQKDKELNLTPTIDFSTYCFIHEKNQVIDYICTVITILVVCVDQNKSEQVHKCHPFYTATISDLVHKEKGMNHHGVKDNQLQI